MRRPSTTTGEDKSRGPPFSRRLPFLPLGDQGRKVGVLLSEGAGGLRLAQLFEVRCEGGQVSQGLLVIGTFLAAGMF